LSIIVRPERPDDVAAIRRVHDAAFGGPVEGRIVDDLRGTDDWYVAGSLVAEEADDAGVVGHLLLSRAMLVGEHGDATPIGVIGPVGVVPERQGQGIGAALMWRAIDVATELRLPAICLLGHADYYPRFGFEPARHLGLEPPHAWPDANWMALPLPDWSPGLRGGIRLPVAFPDE
jgi:putative acetyltransferase